MKIDILCMILFQETARTVVIIACTEWGRAMPARFLKQLVQKQNKHLLLDTTRILSGKA